MIQGTQGILDNGNGGGGRLSGFSNQAGDVESGKKRRRALIGSIAENGAVKNGEAWHAATSGAALSEARWTCVL
jgi:hypothetical protein